MLLRTSGCGLIVNGPKNAKTEQWGLKGVDWIWRKIDTFIGAVVVAAAGIAASQAQAFMVQYVQRLGGALDEAKRQLTAVTTGLRFQLMSEAVQKELKAEAEARVRALQDAYQAIVDSNVIAKPFMLLRHADPVMLEGTWRDFVPMLPTSSDSIFYIAMAMILGFLVYEFVKLPILLLTEPRQRKFRKRG